jgi:hypothetical protein
MNIMNSKRKYSVLVIGPRHERMGGVADYLKMLISNLNHEFESHYFCVGRKNPANSFILVILGFV